MSLLNIQAIDFGGAGQLVAVDTETGMRRNQFSSDSLYSMGSMADSDSNPTKLKKPSAIAAMYAPLVNAGYAAPSPAGPTVTSTFSQNPNIPMKMKLREKQDAAQKGYTAHQIGSLHVYAKSNIRRWEPAGLNGAKVPGMGKTGNVMGSYTSM
jgi:hypothetical protein